jgi:hypothetical protein
MLWNPVGQSPCCKPNHGSWFFTSSVGIDELEKSDLVDKLPIVTDNKHRDADIFKESFKPHNRVNVQMISWFVEEQNIPGPARNVR